MPVYRPIHRAGPGGNPRHSKHLPHGNGIEPGVPWNSPYISTSEFALIWKAIRDGWILNIDKERLVRDLYNKIYRTHGRKRMYACKAIVLLCYWNHLLATNRLHLVKHLPVMIPRLMWRIKRYGQ